MATPEEEQEVIIGLILVVISALKTQYSPFSTG
jgi:hypothetical protein